MLHPSYGELIEKVNEVNREKELPEVNSRYSVVMAAAKRARSIIDGDRPMTGEIDSDRNVLSSVVEEMEAGKIGIKALEAETVVKDPVSYEDMAVVDFSRDPEDEE